VDTAFNGGPTALGAFTIISQPASQPIGEQSGPAGLPVPVFNAAASVNSETAAWVPPGDENNDFFRVHVRGLPPLASDLQFIDQERVIRMLGPDGAYAFETFTPDAIQGALDYDIEAASATETEAIRKDQKNQLLQMAGAFWPNAVPAVFEDLLKEFCIKETTRYILGDPQIQQALMQMQMQQQMMQQQMAAQMAGAAPGMEGPQGPPASGEPLPPEAPQPQEAPVG